MRIAIIGAGIAGLAASSRLHEKGHQVTVYESADRIGGHAQTILVPSEKLKKEVPIELGVFMHEPTTMHPQMNQYAAKYGVEIEPLFLSVAVEHEKTGINWNSGFEGPTWIRNGLIAANAILHGSQNIALLADLNRFISTIKQDVYHYGDISVGEFTNKRLCSEELLQTWILPHMLCWWGIPRSIAMDCSLLAIIDSMSKVSKLQQYIFPKGWRQLIQSIAAPFNKAISLNTYVEAVRRTGNGVEVFSKKGKCLFDAVVFAVEPSIAAKILKEPSPSETKILNGFSTTATTVYLHQDSEWTPKKQPRSIVNLLSDRRGDYCTFWCGGVHPDKPDIYVSWGDELKFTPRDDLMIKTARFERTLPTLSYMKLCKEINTIQGKGGLWYCGAHVHALKEHEIPSLWHENALLSGFQVAESLGRKVDF